MLVKDIMTEPVVTIREDQSILEAREIQRRQDVVVQAPWRCWPSVVAVMSWLRCR